MTYELKFTEDARKQLKKLRDKQYLKRLEVLLDDTACHPFTGIGKPEALKYELSGCWSRRIDKKNRLVYEIIEPNVIIISVVGHY